MRPTEKNFDHIPPEERVAFPDYRKKVPQFGWAAVALVALLLLAFENVRHRDAIADLEERHAAEVAGQIAAGIAEALKRREAPAPGKCTTYRLHMERITLTHCIQQPRKL